MSFLWMLIIGLVVGAVAKLLTPGKDPSGCLVTSLLGIAGALLAGYLGRGMGWYQEGQPVGFLSSVLGAVVILLVFRLVSKR